MIITLDDLVFSIQLAINPWPAVNIPNMEFPYGGMFEVLRWNLE